MGEGPFDKLRAGEGVRGSMGEGEKNLSTRRRGDAETRGGKPELND